MVIKTLSKTLTRDMSLIAMECWYRGKTSLFKEFFDFHHPKSVLLFRDGAVEFYTDKEEYNTYLPRKLADWLNKNKEDVGLVHQYMKDGLKLFSEIGNSEKRGVNVLLEDLQRVIGAFTHGYLGVFISHHLPIFNEEFIQKGERLCGENMINKIIKWREAEGNILFNEGNDMIYSLLNEIAEKMGWEKGLLKFITFEELKRCIKEKKEFPLGILKKRRDSYFAYFNYKIFYEYEINGVLGGEGYMIKMEEVSQDIKEIKGNSANIGHAVGSAKLVFNREELDKVGYGDILVAPMTSPYHITAIEKASAIVTDEGGITCHAAIISREMNKPCVVATKIATKVFKDGDRIAVDADKGIVRKIT